MDDSRPSDGPRWVRRPGAPLLAALAAAFGFLWLGRHPFTDEGSVCHAAARLLEGGVLYRDVWNEKTPLHYVLAALWALPLGASVASMRALATFELFVVLVLMVRVAAPAPWFAVLATLALAPWYQAHHGLQEASLAPLALATVAVSASGSAGALLGAGALAATGVWVKQSFAAIVLAFAGEGRRTLLRVGAGAVAAGLAWLAIVAWHAGDGLLRMPPFGEREAALPFVRAEWGEDKTLLALHLALVGAVVAWSRRAAQAASLERRLASAALWMALPALLRPGAFRAWPSAVLAIAAAARLVGALPAPARRRVLAVGSAALAVVGVARWGVDDGDHRALQRVADRVAAWTPGREAVWVGPHESLLYCLADRRSPVPVDFALPWSPSLATRRETVAALRSSPPLLVVDASGVYSRWQGRLADNAPGIDELLASRYRLVETVEGFDLWLRRDGP